MSVDASSGLGEPMSWEEYAARSAPHDWILDPRDRCLDAYDLRDGFYEPVAHIGDGETGKLTFAGVTVAVDLTRILP